MAITFDSNVGLIAQDTDTIREAIVADWQTIFDDDGYTLNTSPESPAGQIIDSLSVLESAKDAEIMYLANQFNPLTNEGIWQDAIGKIYYLTRKIKESTLVNCTCTGLNGTVIPAGSIVQDGNGNQFASVAAGTIPATGTIDIVFGAVVSGPLDVAAGAVNKIITVIPGWDTITNTAAGAAGRVEETRAEFEARRYASVAKNAHGSITALKGALADLDGVLDLGILENRGTTSTTIGGVSVPGHSIAICIYGGDDTEIARTLYNRLDAGCGTSGGTEVSYVSTDYCLNKYEILRPTPTNVYIVVTYTQTDLTPATIINDIKDAVFNDFYGLDTNSGNTRVQLGSTLYASRFSVCVIKSAKVENLDGITIGWSVASQGSSITINANIEPVLSKANISVVSLEV